MSTNTQSDKTTFIEPFSVDFDLIAGVMKNPKNHLVRRASDMRGYYRDEKALEALIAADNPVHYEVFECPVPSEYGHLMFCISDLKPGRVGDECFMTKGHYHTQINTARYDVFDADAVLAVLDSGVLAGLALDAFDAEPPMDARLTKHPRAIVTPHVGGFTRESIDRAMTVAVDNLLAAL